MRLCILVLLCPIPVFGMDSATLTDGAYAMLFMPTDDFLLGPLDSHQAGILAELIGQDLLERGEAITALVLEVETLLTAVDRAISVSSLEGDAGWEQMRRSWCFIGPGMLRRIEVLKFSASHATNNPKTKLECYSMLGVMLSYLTIRRQTLELNGIEVLKG